MRHRTSDANHFSLETESKSAPVHLRVKGRGDRVERVASATKDVLVGPVGVHQLYWDREAESGENPLSVAKNFRHARDAICLIERQAQLLLRITTCRLKDLCLQRRELRQKHLGFFGVGTSHA